MEVIGILWQGLRKLGLELEISRVYGMDIETFKQEAMRNLGKAVGKHIVGRLKET